MNDRDHRQYELMATALDQFQAGKVALPTLIGTLKSLLNSLENADQMWREDFVSEWGQLEIIYAVALDRVEQSLAPDIQTTINDPANRELINKAVLSLQKLVKNK
jgi:hypothetical protein